MPALLDAAIVALQRPAFFPMLAPVRARWTNRLVIAREFAPPNVEVVQTLALIVPLLLLLFRGVA